MLECHVTRYGSTDLPPSVKWYHNNTLLPISHNKHSHYIITDKSGFVLNIHHLQLTDSGHYQCKVFSGVNSGTLNMETNLSVRPKGRCSMLSGEKQYCVIFVQIT